MRGSARAARLRAREAPGEPVASFGIDDSDDQYFRRFRVIESGETVGDGAIQGRRPALAARKLVLHAIRIERSIDERDHAIDDAVCSRILGENLAAAIHVQYRVRIGDEIVAGNARQRRIALIKFIVGKRDRRVAGGSSRRRKTRVCENAAAFFHRSRQRAGTRRGTVAECSSERSYAREVRGQCGLRSDCGADELNAVDPNEVKLAGLRDQAEYCQARRCHAFPDTARRRIERRWRSRRWWSRRRLRGRYPTPAAASGDQGEERKNCRNGPVHLLLPLAKLLRNFAPVSDD